MKKVIAVIIVLLLINCVLWLIPSSYTRISTKNDELDNATKELVSSIENEVKIYHVVTPGSEDENIVSLLKDVSALNNKIIVESISPDSDAASNLSSSSSPIADNSIALMSGTRSTVLPNSYLYDTSDEQNSPTDNTSEQPENDLFIGEKMLDEALDYVTVVNEYKAYLIGSGDESASDTIGLLENDLADIKLLDSGDEIPDDALCAIVFMSVTGEVSDITTDELKALRDYMSEGGKVIIYTNGAEKIAADETGMTYTHSAVDTPNIDALLSDLAVSRAKNIIIESDESKCFKQYNYYTGQSTAVPYVGQTQIKDENLKKLTSYSFLAQPIVVKKDKPDTITITEIFSSSKTSFRDPDFWDNYVASNDITKEDKDPVGPFTIGIISENSENGSKAVYVSSALLDENGSINKTMNVEFMKLIGEVEAGKNKETENDYSSVKPKSLSNTSSIRVSEAASQMWMMITSIIIPVLTVLIGVIVIFVRRSKSKQA